MDVTQGTINAAMDCVAAMAIEEIASTAGVAMEAAAASFLCSHTAELLFDDRYKLWGDGPSSIVDDYLREVGVA